jgi:uncharacterized membrane protein YfcA
MDPKRDWFEICTGCLAAAVVVWMVAYWWFDRPILWPNFLATFGGTLLGIFIGTSLKRRRDSKKQLDR